MELRNKIFIDQDIDHLQALLFFDEGKNIQRYDSFKYPFFDRTNEMMKGFFWTPDEISMVTDASDYKNLTKEEKFVFTENLSYQILLDSLASRTPAQLFGSVCTNNELESCFITQTFFESIHSKSYTHILRSLGEFELFDGVLSNIHIMDRASSIVKHLNLLDSDIVYFRSGTMHKGKYEMKIFKRQLVRGLTALNILEGLRFYVSFACTFSFAEKKKMSGSANIMKLIARDEKMHLGFISKLLNILRESESEGFKHIFDEEFDAELLAMYEDAMQEEKKWAEHLLGDGVVNGLSKENLWQYVDHIGYLRIKGVGLTPKIPRVSNPIPWVDKYNKSSHIEVLPQETEITSYVTGLDNREVANSVFEF